MTTLIYACRLDGTVTGRCDSRCYDAVTPECDCICGGANHGVGLKAALEQALETYNFAARKLADSEPDINLVLAAPLQFLLF